MLMITIKVLILISALVRLFFVNYNLFYNSFVQIDTLYFVERLSKGENKRVSEEHLKRISNKEMKIRSIELVVLYIIILIIGII